ncbi:carbon-nitrogen hydrolase [Aspergillus ellipticus CBS 707.79]|uniref:Carbon-nitrogen hydrolase n=1 Tax=Aspergillus ellipticus CBS 707.79 TaxID=1448320 RepID=A0A319DCS1_9EURO|nr:carbon-nitrogen hydrolase [Aspergillus ellipticus CBS 707.79]
MIAPMIPLKSLFLCASTILAGLSDLSQGAALPTQSNSNSSLKVALVRSPPPNWPLPLGSHNWTGIEINITQAVDQGIHLIQEAKQNGADLLAFPELWFPGFPKGRELYNWKETHFPSFIKNAIVVGGHDWTRLIAAIRQANIWTSLSFVERRGDHIFMAPSGSERDIFTDGNISELKVVNTEIGRVGMLECAEHWYPSMTFPLAAQRPKLHIGNFPYVLDDCDDSEAWSFHAGLTKAATGSYAFLSGAYVLMPAVGYAFIMDNITNIVVDISASVDFDETPILYHTFPNSSLFFSDETYDEDAQISWGVLQQISEGFPTDIPQEEGNLVPHREVSVAQLLRGNFTWSETGFVSPVDQH